MVSEDATRTIGLFSDNDNLKNAFRYAVNGVNVINDNTVGYIGEIMKFRFMAYTSEYGGFATHPRNLRLSIMPQCGYAHIIENSIPSYTRRDLSDKVDWSGRWKFVVESDGYISLSGVELIVQQNV